MSRNLRPTLRPIECFMEPTRETEYHVADLCFYPRLQLPPNPIRRECDNTDPPHVAIVSECFRMRAGFTIMLSHDYEWIHLDSSISLSSFRSICKHIRFYWHGLENRFRQSSYLAYPCQMAETILLAPFESQERVGMSQASSWDRPGVNSHHFRALLR